MRIIAGAWRGRTLQAPPGQSTRPTSQRMRQTIFDILMHAPWGGHSLMQGAHVLDGFAGTGAMGLEALSRGAAHAHFIDRNPQALATLRANIAACRATDRATILATDIARIPPGPPQQLVFLDPPYHHGLVPPAVATLRAAGWINSQTIIVAETENTDHSTNVLNPLLHRIQGAAQLLIWRA